MQFLTLNSSHLPLPLPLPFSQSLLESVWAQTKEGAGETGGIPRQSVYVSDWDAC